MCALGIYYTRYPSMYNNAYVHDTCHSDRGNNFILKQ